MARTKKVVRRYRKVRWAPNISEFNGTETVPASDIFSYTTTLTTNPIQSANLVSQTYTVKNFDISFTIDLTNTTTNSIEDLAVYIMYVPQGMNIGADYNLQHPEYVMNYKFIGSPSYDGSTSGQQYQPIKVRSRLARKLQTGDSVILFVKGRNQASNAYALEFHGLIRWWTKAN